MKPGIKETGALGKPKNIGWKAKKKFNKKKKLGLVISTINASQNWKKVADQIKTVQTRYKKKTKTLDKPTKEATQDEAVKNEISPEKPEETKNEPKLTKAVALDCEMVGVGENGVDSILARVSLVNEHCECVYDAYVMPTEEVTDYRTPVSGIRASDLTRESGAKSFKVVQKEVTELIEGRILVGHSLNNDLDVLFLSHPRKKTRDTQKVSKLFRQVCPMFKGGRMSLKNLAKQLLGIDIQEGEHSSVQDAQAAMRIYKTYKKEWESYLRTRKLGDNQKTSEAKGMKILNMKQTDSKGNENHKRFIENKLKKRNNFLKVFKK